MITLQGLFRHLETLLPATKLPDTCLNGVQVEGREQIRTVALSVSASVAAIEAAAKMKADALIVHHGIFWQKDSQAVCGTKRKKLQLLLENGISLIAYHLPLDAHPSLGNNWKAARDLGWTELQAFEEIGVQGRFAKRPIAQLARELELYYAHPAHTALGGKGEVTSGALISGRAYSWIEQAADAGVDCFITGSFDEPVWNSAFERGIHFLALGHHATERIGVQALGEHLRRQFSLPCTFFDFPNPF